MAKQLQKVSRSDIRYRVLAALYKAYFGKKLDTNFIQVCNTFWKVFFGTILLVGPVAFLLRITVGPYFKRFNAWMNAPAEDDYDPPVWAKKTGSIFAFFWKCAKDGSVFAAKKLWWAEFPVRWTLKKFAKGVAWLVVVSAQKSAPFFKRNGENIFVGLIVLCIGGLLGLGVYELVIAGLKNGWWASLAILGGIIGGVALIVGLVVFLEKHGGFIWKKTKTLFKAVWSVIVFFARMFWSALVGFKENHCPVWKVVE